MRFIRRLVLFGLVFAFCMTVWAENVTSAWFSRDINGQVVLQVDLFLSSKCPHCQKADRFFSELAVKNKWLNVHRYMIDQDKKALETYHQFQLRQQVNDFAVPAIFFCDTRWVGFDKAQTSGRHLLKHLEFCRQQIRSTGALSNATVQFLRQEASASWYKDQIIPEASSQTLLLWMTLFEAMNPLLSWFVLSLFALLILQKERKQQVACFFLFLAGAGLAQYLFQWDLAFVYERFDFLRPIVALIGLGVLAFAAAQRLNFFTALRHPSGMALYLPVFLLAFSIKAYQQTANPNITIIFHQWVMSQDPGVAEQILYHAFFQLAALLMLGLMAAVPAVLVKYYGQWSLYGRLATEFSWQYLAVVGLVLLACPSWFTSVLCSFLTSLLVLILSWITFKCQPTSPV